MCKQDLKILLRNLLFYIMWTIILLFVRKAYSADISNNWEFFEIPDRSPKQIVIDNANRKWISVAVGVQVLDGEEWYKYTQKNSGLPYYGINCLKVDHENNIWFGTEKGAARFDGETWEIFDEDDTGIAADRVIDVAFDNNGGVWFTSGLKVSHFDGSAWETYIDETESSYAIRCITVDDENDAWFGMYHRGIKRFDGSSWRTYNDDNSGIAGNNVTTLAITSDGDKLLIGTTRGLSEFDGEHWKSWDDEVRNALAINFDSNGFLWVVNGSYFSCYDGETWAFFSDSDIPKTEEYSDRDIEIRDMAIDSEDNIWLVTNIGLYRYTPQFVRITGTSQFEGEMYHPGDAIDLSWLTNRVQDVTIEYSINGKSQWQKIEKSLNADLKTYTYILPSDVIPQEYYSMKMTIRISSGDSPDIFDEIYFYIEENDLQESFVTFTPDNSGVLSEYASIIYEDKSGAMWFVSKIGVSRYDGSSWTAFTAENSDLVTNDINSLYEDVNGGMWFLSGAGVSGYDGATWTTFTAENSGLFCNYVNHMASTPDGSLWFGTSAGLSEFDGETWRTWFEGESIMYLAVGRNGRVFTLFHHFDLSYEKVACHWHAPHEWEIVSFDGEQWVQETEEYSTINVIGTGPDGYLWFNTFQNKMIKYDGVTWNMIDCPEEVFWIKKTGVEGCIAWGRDGTLWVDDNRSLYYYDEKEWQNFIYTDFSPGYMSAAPDGSLFCANYYDGFAEFNGYIWKTYLHNNGGAFYRIYSIFVDSHNVKWLSGNEGIVRFDNGAAVTVNVTETPEEITLLRNFPNPFNLSTTISFSLTLSDFTELVIYNIMGQKVRTLLTDYQMAGTHSVVWDGRDDLGKSVSSGIYLNNLKAGNTECTGKMLLIK